MEKPGVLKKNKVGELTISDFKTSNGTQTHGAILLFQEPYQLIEHISKGRNGDNR